jgi:ABC-type glycerol-3-phosphate transport system substrate-binding protein
MLLSHWEDVVVADREGNFKITEDPHFGQVMDWLKAWSTSGIAFPTEDFSPDWQPGFASGAIGGVLSGNWLMSFLPKFAPEQKGLWGMTQFPDFNDRGSEAGGGVMVIPEGSVQKEAAFELAAKMFLEVPGSLSELAYTGAPPVIAAAEARRAEALGRPQGMSDEEWNITPQGFFGDDFLEPTLESLKKFDVFNYDPGAQAELDLMRRETEAYISGAKTRDQALRDLEQSMESQIGNPFEI